MLVVWVGCTVVDRVDAFANCIPGRPVSRLGGIAALSFDVIVLLLSGRGVIPAARFESKR